VKTKLVYLLMAGLFIIQAHNLSASTFKVAAKMKIVNKFNVNSLYLQQSSHSGAKKPLIIAGAITFGTFYIGGIVLDNTIDNSVNFSELYIPVIGPFLARANYDDKVSPDYDAADLEKTLFVLDGIVQAAGAVMLITGLAMNYSPDGKLINIGKSISQFSIAPVPGKGFRAGYRFSF
jgi:hypothetical protein